jgi:hypothetical protein
LPNFFAAKPPAAVDDPLSPADVSSKEDKMSEQLQKLIDASRGRTMSDAEKEAQRRSFAYGNAHIENERVTRAMIDEAAEKIGKAE